MIEEKREVESDKLYSDIISLKQLYGLIVPHREDTAIHIDNKARMMLKDLLDDATRRLLDNQSSKMVETSQPSSGAPTKVFTMSPEEENPRRTKLRRIDSPDISTAAPVPNWVPDFGNPTLNSFVFTAKKDELKTPRARRREFVKNHVSGNVYCRACVRSKVLTPSPTVEYEPLGWKQWPTSRANPFSMSSKINFEQSGQINANYKLRKALQLQCISQTSAQSSAIPYAESTIPSGKEKIAGKELENGDQMVKEVSEMVKRLESGIAALKLFERKEALPASDSQVNSQPYPEKKETVNPFLLMKHPQHPSDRSSPVAANTSSSQQSPLILNSRPVFTFPSQASSPALSPSYIHTWKQNATPSQQSVTSSQRQSPVPSGPSQIEIPSPRQSGVKNQKLSSIPSQELSSTPWLSVKNIVQRLESLSASHNRNDQASNSTPKYGNGFMVSNTVSAQSKMEKANMQKNPITRAGLVESTSSAGQAGVVERTRTARNLKSKYRRSRSIMPCQQSSGSSGSLSSSSSSFSSSPENDQYSYSSTSGSIPRQIGTSESEVYSAEETSSLASGQTMRRRRPLGTSSFNGHRRKEEYSTEETSSSASGQSMRRRRPLGASSFNGRRRKEEYSTEETSSSASGQSMRRRRPLGASSFNGRRRKEEYPTEETSSSASGQSMRRRRPVGASSFNGRRYKDAADKPISTLRKIKNKLGLIFHHHHHHHHHHTNVETNKSKWKKIQLKKTVAQQQQHGVAAGKSVVTGARKNQQGHFHALLDGLMKHVQIKKKKRKKKKFKQLGRQKKKVMWKVVGLKHPRKPKIKKLRFT